MITKGKLHRKFDTAQVSPTFTKREFVVEIAENPQYPQLVKFELAQDRCSILDKFNEGDMIEVSFDLRGRKWQKDSSSEEKFFNELAAWKIYPAESNGQAAATGSGETKEVLPF